MLSLKKFALTTLTVASVGLLTLPQISNAERQKIGESLMPTVTQTHTANNIATRKVQFQSQGTLVVGNLYLPTTRSKGAQPAVVVVGPQSSVKEQVPAVYARKLAEQGFVALTFDHRTYGESGGAPRQFENPQMKVQDIHSAVTFLRALPEVKHSAVGLLGVCSGGGYSAKAAAMDKSINALVTVAGFYHDPQVMRQWLGENYEARLKMGKEARIKYEKTGQVDYMTNVDPKNQNVAMPGQEAYDYY
jgi:cephalosporin-C deacetylase-like acetyl esterase